MRMEQAVGLSNWFYPIKYCLGFVLDSEEYSERRDSAHSGIELVRCGDPQISPTRHYIKFFGRD